VRLPLRLARLSSLAMSFKVNADYRKVDDTDRKVFPKFEQKSALNSLYRCPRVVVLSFNLKKSETNLSDETISPSGSNLCRSNLYTTQGAK